MIQQLEQPQSVIRFDRSQKAVFEDKSRIIGVNFHRQKGKDFVAAAKAVDEALSTGQDWFIFGMTQGQADETFLKCKRVVAAMKQLLKRKFGTDQVREDAEEFDDIDRDINQKFRAVARTLHMPNGARVISLPGRNPDGAAGRTGNMIWTEFGLWHRGGYDHWATLFPIINRKGYRIVIISTPRGKNTKFYEVMQNAEGLYSTHACDIYKSVFEEGYQLYDTKGQPFPQDTREEQEQAIATFRRLYNDEGKWPREYGCEFSGDLSALVPWAELERAAGIMPADAPFSFVRIDGDGMVPRRVEWATGAPIAIGWDVARRGHLSVVAINELRPGKPSHLRGVIAMRDVSFAGMRGVVTMLMDTNRRSVGYGDATGLGMESNEELQKRYRDRWTPFTFTGAGKREVASALRTAFSDGMQTLPPMSGPHKLVATDIYAIQKDDTGANLIIEETPNPLCEESHCDIAYAIGLARLAGARSAVMPLPAPRRKKPVGW